MELLGVSTALGLWPRARTEATKGNRPGPQFPPQETTSSRESLGSRRIPVGVHANAPPRLRHTLAHVPNADGASQARHKDQKKPHNNRGSPACPTNSPVYV